MNEAGKRIAIVTGGSRGIGASIARGLGRRELSVVVGARDAALGEQVAQKSQGTFRRLDLADPASIDAFAAAVVGVDVLVNNAGASFDGFDADVAKRTLQVNVRGAMRLTDRLLPKMRAGARVVMVSSGMGELSCLSPELQQAFLDPSLDRAGLEALMDRFVADVRAGQHGERGWPSNAYRVSKVALNAYVRILARDLADDPRRILVNAACPGWVRTEMGGESAPRSPAEGAKTPLWLATLPDDGPQGGFFRDERAIPW